MGMFRWLFGVIGVALIALPFLLPDVIPEGSLIGIDALSNDILSIITGILLLILVFWSLRRARRRRMMQFGWQPRFGDARIMPAMTPEMIKAIEERKRREAEMIRKGYAMQMRRQRF